MSICHIIGNGPSCDLFGGWDGDIYGCNTPHLDLPYKAVGMMDSFVPLYLDQTGEKLDAEIWTPEELHNHLKKHEIDLETKPCIEFAPSVGLAMATRLTSYYEEIHLWGFDSFHSRINESMTDDVHATPIRNKWLHHYWIDWFENRIAPFGNFIVHMPSDVDMHYPMRGVDYVRTDPPAQTPQTRSWTPYKPINTLPLDYCYRFHFTTPEGKLVECWYGDVITIEYIKEELKQGAADGGQEKV